MSYAGREKYDAPGKAGAYRDRNKKRHREEWALLARVIDTLPSPPASALDVPCGTGRIAAELLARGIPTRCADLSPAMREETLTCLGEVGGFGGVEALDLEAVPEDATQAELVVCFRFLHHLPSPEHRARVLAGLRKLTSGHLLVSFHHPVSVHNLDRAVKRLIRRRGGDRYTISKRRLAAEAQDAGFEVVRWAALGAYRRELWVALLR